MGNWGREFILFLPQAALLPGSDVGGDGAEVASGFIQNRLTSCSIRSDLQFAQWRHTPKSVKERDPNLCLDE